MKNLEHPSLYVKSFHTYNGDETGIKMIFEKARAMAPCLLILEDIDSLITKDNRSFFLNEVDGLEENDGILVIATTNHCKDMCSEIGLWVVLIWRYCSGSPGPGYCKPPFKIRQKILLSTPINGREKGVLQILEVSDNLKRQSLSRYTN